MTSLKVKSEVVALSAEGLNREQIGERLKMSPWTVRRILERARMTGEISGRAKPGPKEGSSHGWKHKRLDVIPCPRCSLRGHEAGDPIRCLTGAGRSTGMGQWGWCGPARGE